MYGISTYKYHTNQANVGKFTIPMDPSWVYGHPSRHFQAVPPFLQRYPSIPSNSRGKTSTRRMDIGQWTQAISPRPKKTGKEMFGNVKDTEISNTTFMYRMFIYHWCVG